MKPEHVYVIITAGGQGTRMGSALPKQFLDICGKPVLYYTLKAFADALPEAQLILVLPAGQISYAQMALQHFTDRLDLTLVSGGPTRFHSVKNGLKGLSPHSIILVHDGVRPLASKELIQRCYEGAMANGTAIPAIAVSDSIRRVSGNMTTTIVDRTALSAIQTPQAFRGDILLKAFEQQYNESFTDEASVVETAGGTICLVEGERRNIKITTPEDLIVAEAFLKPGLPNAVDE